MVYIDPALILKMSALYKKAIEKAPETLRSLNVPSLEPEDLRLAPTQKDIKVEIPVDEGVPDSDYTVLLNEAKQSIENALDILYKVPQKMENLDQTVQVDFDEAVYSIGRARVLFNRDLGI